MSLTLPEAGAARIFRSPDKVHQCPRVDHALFPERARVMDCLVILHSCGLWILLMNLKASKWASGKGVRATVRRYE